MSKLPIFNYKITNQGDDRLEVFIDGDIVDAGTQEFLKNWWNEETSVSFKSFRSQILASERKNISITINSRGGQLFEALAMHDFIKQLERDGYNVETIGIGMICSAATCILSAAKNSRISKNAYYMIHNVSGGVWGDVNEIERYAAQMRRFNDNARSFYAKLTGKSEEEIQAMMDAETWFYGKEAVDNGFVKELISEQTPSGIINQSDWTFRDKRPMNVYNSFAGSMSENRNETLENIDMNKFVEAIVNAFKTNKLVVTPENAVAEPLTVENLTAALNLAVGDMETEPSDEKIQNSVNKYFENGLPENFLNQIKEAVALEQKDISEDESFKRLEENVKKIEEQIINKTGATQPPVSEEKKYEGVEFE